MPGEEVQVEAGGGSRARTGPRHAAPRKSLIARIQVPAGKAIALAAMPTAVLMGMGFTPRFAQADELPDNPYKSGPCVSAPDKADDAAKDEDKDKDKKDSKDDDKASPSPSASPGQDAGKPGSDDGKGSSDDAKPGDKPDDPAPKPSPSQSTGGGGSSSDDSGDSGDSGDDKPGGILDPIIDPITDILGGGKDKDDDEEPSATPSPSATSSTPADDKPGDPADKPAKKPSADDPVGDVLDKVTGKDKDKAGDDKAKDDSASPSASPSETATDPSGKEPFPCPDEKKVAGEDEQTPSTLPDEAWTLKSSLLTLYNLNYKGVVNVRTANGNVKQVLKFTASGVDIKDLHQLVKGPLGVTQHIEASEGSTSTIRSGTVTMYTEKLSGKLLGAIPITFDPEHQPPPIPLPVIFFSDVTVEQAGQFGGTLTVPGLRGYRTGGPGG